MPAIDLHVFSDFACPWCYVGTERLDKLTADYDVTLHWHPFLLRADTPEMGMHMSEIFPPGELAEKQRYLLQVVEEAGLPYKAPEWFPNTRLAHEAACFAEAHGQGDAFHRAVLHAYHAENKDIGDAAVLVEIAEGLGLDAKALAEALAEGKYRDEVLWAIDQARQMGVRSVPTFVFGTGAAFAGAQPYEVFKQVVEEHVLPSLNNPQPVHAGCGCGHGGCGCGHGGCGCGGH